VVSPTAPAGGRPHRCARRNDRARALLGGILVARNRYEEPASLAADPETHHEEFVTDREERVRQLLRENGGRMKQSSIVDSVDWSKAKVSRLLADLEEDEQITKLRLSDGRTWSVCRVTNRRRRKSTRTGERRLVTVHPTAGRAACGVPILVTGTENGTDRRPFLSAIVVFRERTRH